MLRLDLPATAADVDAMLAAGGAEHAVSYEQFVQIIVHSDQATPSTARWHEVWECSHRTYVDVATGLWRWVRRTQLMVVTYML